MRTVNPAALHFAVTLFKGTTCFGLLAEGARFHFPKHPEAVYTKGRKGWFADATDRKFRTSGGTAVVEVKS